MALVDFAIETLASIAQGMYRRSECDRDDDVKRAAPSLHSISFQRNGDPMSVLQMVTSTATITSFVSCEPTAPSSLKKSLSTPAYDPMIYKVK
jgi:hypothetical protein